MRRLLHAFVFLFPFFVFSQPYVTVDVDTYTHEELILDVLINNPCAIVDNVTSVTGTDFGSLNGIGYFENTNANFPMENGIVLSTTNALQVPGPNGSPQDAGDWPGDDQLFDYIQALGIDPGLTSYNDASIMEFDFTPLNDSISFNFVFASNEYGTFQCSYSDAFAFFLENTDTGEITNMALVPDTPGEVPISVTTIRDQAHNGGCASANPDFFSTYYGATGLPNSEAPINFNGHTVLMQAWSYVTANTTYRMKLVIADRNDSSFNSAVFIQGGSFFLGVDLGDDVTIDNGNAVCATEAIVIGIQGSIDPDIAYQWYVYDEDLMDFVLLPGETGPILEVEESGTYQLEVTFSNGCSATDEIFVEFVPQPIAGIPDDLIACDSSPNDGFAEFDLTEADDQIIDGQADVFVSYFETYELAETGDPADQLISPYTNIVPGSQVVFARLEETSEFSCYEIVELTLQVNPAPEIADPITDFYVCDDDQDGFEIFDLTSKDTEILNGLFNMEIDYYNTFDDADQDINPIGDPVNYNSGGGETIFVRVESLLSECYTVGQFDLLFHPAPIFTNPTPFIQINGSNEFDLTVKIPEISGGNPNVSISFHIDEPDAWAGVNPLPLMYTSVTNPQIIWVRVRNINTGCVALTTLELFYENIPVLIAPEPLEYCDPDNDGFGDFDLESTIPEITGGDPDISVTFHETQANAENGILPLPNPYPNVVIYNQTVYARGESITSGSHDIVPLELQVLDSPQIEDPSPLVQCDYNSNGTSTFDLTL
ncbi:choice-of-anchor L domain-containing protein, partial [Planktosalinus lacus]|uniref:choice-of-anchor L domain-containing protein n=1 Tax=Planktosalinus lacus TaxID=1526573 RepID=UPI00166BD7FD